RAWRYYAEAAPLLQLISVDSQAALWTLSRIYSRILEKIEAIGYDVLSKPHPRLSAAEKAWIMVRAGTGLWTPELCLPRTWLLSEVVSPVWLHRLLSPKTAFAFLW